MNLWFWQRKNMGTRPNKTIRTYVILADADRNHIILEENWLKHLQDDIHG